MAEFAKCHICRALMVDDPDDRREHLGDHANTKRRIDALGRANAGYLTEIAGLRDQIKGYGAQLEQHPISASPESITVNEMPDDEIDEFEDEVQQSEFIDATGISQETGHAYASAVDAFVQPSTADYPPAIDRDDPTPTPIYPVDMFGNRLT